MKLCVHVKKALPVKICKVKGHFICTKKGYIWTETSCKLCYSIVEKFHCVLCDYSCCSTCIWIDPLECVSLFI